MHWTAGFRFCSLLDVTGPPPVMSNVGRYEHLVTTPRVADRAFERVDWVLRPLVHLSVGLPRHKSKLEGRRIRRTCVDAAASCPYSLEHVFTRPVAFQSTARRRRAVATD